MRASPLNIRTFATYQNSKGENRSKIAGVDNGFSGHTHSQPSPQHATLNTQPAHPTRICHYGFTRE